MNCKEKHQLFLEGKYVSYHSRVNTPFGINKDGLKEVLQEMDDEKIWVEAKNFNDIKPGYRIRYIRVEPNGSEKFVAGGYVRKVNYTEQSVSYLSGRVHGVYFKDVVRMWIALGREPNKTRKKKAKPIKPLKFKKPTITEGKHKIYIGDTLVFCTDLVQRKKIFTSTGKYIKALNGYPFEMV